MQIDIKWGQTWNKEWINGGPTEWGGAGLDKYIVNTNENYINYINYNPKLVQIVDNLAVADTGTTGHYLTLNSPWDNKQQVVNLLLILIPSGEIITWTHTSLLSHQDLPIQARKAHIFPGINKALLSIGTLCNHVCESTFNDKCVRILNKWSGKVIMKGTRDPRKNLYILNLTQQNKQMTESTTPDECFAGSAYKCKSKSTLVDYHHTSWWSPTKYGRGKETTKKFFTSWPGLSFDLVHKYLFKKNQPYLGTFSNLEKDSDQHRKR